MSIKNRLKALEAAIKRSAARRGVFTMRILHRTPAGEWGVVSERQTPAAFKDDAQARTIDVYIHRTSSTSA